MTGQRFGSLVILRKVQRPEHVNRRSAYYYCVCDCGGRAVRPIDSLNRRSSCGCQATTAPARAARAARQREDAALLMEVNPVAAATKNRDAATSAALFWAECNEA